MRERGRRRFLRTVAGTLLALEVPLAHAATIVAVRVWPARDYTRVTLELDAPLKTSHSVVADPPRLVVDLEGVELDGALRELVAKVQANDPYIAAVRVGQNRPKVVRLVFDLKAPVAPQVFTLAPIAAYRHRLVLDLHPALPADPLAQLIEQTRGTPAAGGPRGVDTDPGTAAATAVARPEAGAPAGADASALPAVPSGAERSARPGSTTGSTPGSTTGSTPGPTPAPAAGRRPPPADADRGEADPLAALIRDRDRAQPATPRDRRPRVPSPVTRMATVAIDPGHGGEDPGAVGKYGTLEKDVVLAISMRLRDRINAEPNMRAFMTRDADFFVPLATRVAKARAVRADLFVSVHADAFVLPHARGSSVFVLSDRSASSVGARWLASRENRADLIGGVNLPRRNREVARVLLDLSTTEKIRQSKRLGNAVLRELRSIGDLHKISVEQAAFAVLKAPDIPSILVETAFISNPDEERKLRDPRYQDRLAEAIFIGIRRYFRQHPPAPLDPRAA
jgi:N-acetylmuramoyl-L-alanine amidase